MPTVIPVYEFVSEDWYPGFRPGYTHAPWIAEPVGTFSARDEERFWFLDFHWPNGMTPMDYVIMEDAYVWGSQSAAQSLPLPFGKGLTARVAGTHLYGGEVPLDSPWEQDFRAQRFGRNLAPILTKFREIWETRVQELEEALLYLENEDLTDKPLNELGQFLIEARLFLKRAWEIHFELKYPLLDQYLSFHRICTDLGVDPAEVPKFLQGYDNKILETDRELWNLTNYARELGIENVFRTNEPENLYAALKVGGPKAEAWLKKFNSFLREYGHRTDGIADLSMAPWLEDPTPPLGTIKTFLQKGGTFDFDQAHQAAVDEREAAILAAREKLAEDELDTFNQALQYTQETNFAWWNDEHCFWIDFRAHIPLRRACVAVAEAVGAARKDDTLFLFWPELMSLVRGEKKWSHMRWMAHTRRQYYQHWRAMRAWMPKMLGTIPEEVQDPILIETHGLHKHFLGAMRNADKRNEGVMTGIAASSGLVRGRARVLHSADELHRIQPGEILVCESTTTSWTLAFGKIGGCVCDIGGTLAHASIVSREYRLPCVVGVGTGTSQIRTGDEIEVDGSKGVVTILKRSAA